MATNKLSRYQSLKAMGGEKLLPPEIQKLARGMGSLGGQTPKGSNLKDPSGKDLYARLKSGTKDRNFDQDPDLVHKRSPLDYIPPDER